jgi:PPOX class probable F420-dependent enzyme
VTTPSVPPLDALADERYVSLTTFRRSGEPVATPVWVARDGDALVVLTPDGTGKVKRLRNDGRAELRPCSRTGRVAPGTPGTPGHATVLTAPADAGRVAALMRAKYGLEYRVFRVVEPLVRRGGRPRVWRCASCRPTPPRPGAPPRRSVPSVTAYVACARLGTGGRRGEERRTPAPSAGRTPQPKDAP